MKKCVKVLLAVILCGSLAFCVNGTINAQSFSIGQNYQGGIIFYIDSTGQHGLIVAPYDQQIKSPLVNRTEWTIPGASGIDIGTGFQNTTSILANCLFRGETAPYVCGTLKLGGYNDWFLPSIDELDQLFLQKNKIGGFASGYYWSSTVAGCYYGWAQHFFDGSQRLIHPNAKLIARAIRAF